MENNNEKETEQKEEMTETRKKLLAYAMLGMLHSEMNKENE